MKLTGEEARSIVYDEHDDWKGLKDTESIVDNSRWSIVYEKVFQHTPTGKHYMFCWSRGATEYQDERPFECEKEVEVPEVELREVKKMEWVPVDGAAP